MTNEKLAKGWCPKCKAFHTVNEITIEPSSGIITCPKCNEDSHSVDWGINSSNKYPLDRIGVVDWFEPVMINVNGAVEPKRLIDIYIDCDGELQAEYWQDDQTGCIAVDIDEISHYEPKQHRQLTHPEIFQHLVGKYLFKNPNALEPVVNTVWSDAKNVGFWECTPIDYYTGTDSDKWFDLTTEILDNLDVDYVA